MPFGAKFAESAKSFYQKASLATNNAVNGFNFNRNVYEEFNKAPCDYLNEDFECDEEFGSDEEWTAISKTSPRKKYPEEKCLVNSGTAMKLSNVGLTFSKHAIAAASQAAGVSFDYAQTALKFATLETAQGIGYLASSDTATAAIQKLKRRFPLLEDIQRAYSEGQDVQRSRRLGRDPRTMFYDDGEEEMMMADPESGAEMQIVYENSSAQEIGQSHGQFRGGPLDYSNPIIGSKNDSEDLEAKKDAEATESKVDLWLKGVVEKEF